MSKAQINYLLVLATLFIVWLYFGTFLIAAKIDHKVNFAAGLRSPMVRDWSQRQSFATPVFQENQGKGSVNQPFAMPGFPKNQGKASVNQPSAIPSELQKLADMQKTQNPVPAKKK